MRIDPSRVGDKTRPHEFEYDWKTVALYSLGIGAKPDELDYLLETRGPKVYPSFAVIPPTSVVDELLTRTGGDFQKVVHYSEVIRIARDIPAAATLVTVGTLSGIYDLKRLAQVTVTTRTTHDGELCFETECTVIYRDHGGFGGEPPPKRDVPKLPKGAAPCFTYEQQTSKEQALLYRLSGDLNPLHSEPEVAQAAGFPEGPILHGLCTFGFAARAIVLSTGARLVELGTQFKKPVWPGDVLRTEGFDLKSGVLGLQTFASDRPDAVLTGWARIA